ncbi:MAG: hypothetical protein AVDCRST_MAG03-1965, partial [uncultured Rubrobacteraceae bacterium]
APGVRAEPGDRSAARGGLRVALGRGQPPRVPATRGGILRGGALRRGRPRPEDQDYARVPGRARRNLRCRGLPGCGRGGAQDGVGRGGRARLLGVAYGGEPRGGRERGGGAPLLWRTLGGAGDARAGTRGPRSVGGGHLGDAGEHPPADRGGLGQSRSATSSGGGRAAAGGEPGGGGRGPSASV